MLYGWIEGVYFDTVNAAGTNDIDIITSQAEGVKSQRTILSINGVQADTYYPIRVDTVGTAGTGAGTTEDYTRIPLVGDKVHVYLTNADIATTTSTVTIIYITE
jgi:hypothetical protein